MKRILIIVLGLIFCNTVLAEDYTFADYAANAGLTGDETYINANGQGISGLSGLANNYDNLINLSLSGNQISEIDRGDFAGLCNLNILNLYNNQISRIESGAFAGLSSLNSLYLSDNQTLQSLNLKGNNFLYLNFFDVKNCSLEQVLICDTLLNQTSFNAIMKGNLNYDWYKGIAEIDGVKSVDSSRVDFTSITDLSAMYTMNHLEVLILAGAVGLDGDEVISLLGELDSLNYLDVTGAYYGWDATVQNQLLAWDEIEGNTLVIPEPITLSLMSIGAFALLRKRRA